MVIGDEVTAALPLLRAQARSLMTSTVRVSRPGGEPWWDPALEEMVPGGDVVAYEGPARMVRVGAGSTLADAAGEAVAVSPYIVAVPWDLEVEFKDGDLVEVDGLRLRVEAARYGSHRIEVRIGCVEYP